MSINSFLSSKKFSSKPSKKGSVKDTLSSKLNQSVASDPNYQLEFDYRAGGTRIPKGSGTSKRIDYSDQKRHKTSNDYRPRNLEINDWEGKDDIDNNSSYKEKNRFTYNQEPFVGKHSVESELTSQVTRNTKKITSESSQPENLAGKSQVEALLEELSEEARSHLQQLNRVIDTFNKNIQSLIEEQYQKFKNAIMETVDRVFQEATGNFRKTLEAQHEKNIDRALDMRSDLEELRETLTDMTHEARGANWKKVSAELTSKNIEYQLNKLRSDISKLKNLPPIQIQLDRKRMVCYEQALHGLLELQTVQSSYPPRK